MTNPQHPKQYICRTCGKKVIAPAVPAGWYSVTEKSGVYDVSGKPIGIACSTSCLAQLANDLDYLSRWQRQRTHTSPKEYKESAS